jgi:hypothetical protein
MPLPSKNDADKLQKETDLLKLKDESFVNWQLLKNKIDIVNTYVVSMQIGSAVTLCPDISHLDGG